MQAKNVQQHDPILAGARNRFVLAGLGAIIGALALSAGLRAQGPQPCQAQPGTGPQSFTCLANGFTQELYGVTSSFLTGPQGPLSGQVLGGIAFDGADPVVAECLFTGTRFHRFDSMTTTTVNTTSVHKESILPWTTDSRGFGGCGLVNLNGKIYANLDPNTDTTAGPVQPTNAGIVEIDPTSWSVTRYIVSPAGSGLGISVDPITGHLIYVGSDCTVANTGPSCTIVDLDPVSGVSRSLMTLPANNSSLMPNQQVNYIDGLYFEPSGKFIFIDVRAPQNNLGVLSVTTDQSGNRVATLQQQIPMPASPDSGDFKNGSIPDGVAFHATSPKFIVTNNNDGTITRFDFTNDDYTQTPTITMFASGGFRGDLTQVGADGCIYATQSIGGGGATTGDGTRYNNSNTSAESSLVRICEPGGGGFAAPPTSGGGATTGSISGTAFEDNNHDGKFDAGDSVIPNVTITLTGPVGGSVATDNNGNYKFAGLAAGTYTITAPMVAAKFQIETTNPLTPGLAAGQNLPNQNFGYLPGSLAGVVFEDFNGNGIQDTGEPGIGGVSVTLAGASSGNTVTKPDGSYSFPGLAGGGYSVIAPATAAGLARGVNSPSPLAATLVPGANITGLNFGYVPGSIIGFVYEDFNKNKHKDAGEPGISGVVVTLSNGSSSSTTKTDSNGFYSFTSLVAGNYSVSSPATAGGFSLETTSPLSIALAAGQTQEADFGYIGKALPTCTEQAYKGPPFWGTMSFQGVGSGIVSMTITSSVNFSATMTGHTGQIVPPVPPVVTSTFNPPSMSPVVVTATLMDQTKGGEITASATDQFGNTVTCDPTSLKLTELRHEKGNQVLDDVAGTMHVVTIQNNSPGLDALDVVVNGVEFRVRGVPDNGTHILDIGRAMRPGSENRIVLVPRGAPGDSAMILISDQ